MLPPEGAVREDAADGLLAPPATIPPRPRLAPNVQLVGELDGSGFKDRQWLIQRDGQFALLTELLYRIAERADGEQTLDEIAAGVTASTNWRVSADNVRQLIQTKLAPMGLIAAADGSITPPPGAVGRGRPPSPLGLTLRMKVIGPRLIDPITKVLQVLYTPPILGAMLVVIAVAHGWLYLVHGVADTLRLTFSRPGPMLVVYAMMLVAGVCHEFGHAAALRYGGGKVRGMGVGLFLVYPAFYTDVTDGYRLGRWARVRTDLGGFYFHLIFAVGAIALSLISGREFLLFVVVLINLEVLRQLIPVVRLDGYWALVDLTGLPDFFALIGPFVRSTLRLPGSGSKLPPLKPWVKAVFAVYLLVTLPILAVLLFVLLKHTPSLVATLWAAMGAQAAVFDAAQQRGEILGVVLSAAGMLIFALELVGLGYLLYSLAWGGVRAGWTWSASRPRRRLAVGLVAVGLVAAVVALWVP
jgi:putative peptide zinc metalloprotease protein